MIREPHKNLATMKGFYEVLAQVPIDRKRGCVSHQVRQAKAEACPSVREVWAAFADSLSCFNCFMAPEA